MSDRLIFRSSFLVIWRWTSLFCGLLGASVYGRSLLNGHPVEPLSTLGLTLGMGLFFAVAIVLFPVYVVDEGVRCYNFWGIYHTIGWDRVSYIRRRNLLGLRYLEVKSKDGGSIWLPLWLSNMASFTAAIEERAGPDHPLLLAVEKYRVT